MEEIVVPSRTDEAPLFQQMVSQFGGPAFLRRALRAEAAEAALRDKLARTRESWLDMVRLRLAMVYALAGDFCALGPWLSPDDVATLARLHAELRPALRAPIAPTRSAAAIRAALEELSESLRRFNRRWAKHLHTVDLREVNQRRDEYNRYYLLEKECVVGSPRIARQGFQTLPPITLDDVRSWFPLFPEVTPHEPRTK